MALRFYVTAALAALALAVLLPWRSAAMACGKREAAMRATLHWHRLALRFMRVRVRVTGAPSRSRPLLLLPNHISWLDIPVLASIEPVSFVAKQEVGGWPVVGWLARLQRCIFVDRRQRQASGRQADAVAARLAEGEVIVLFAEGTSSDGNQVLPFRSALVGAAQRALAGEARVTVQPVAISYTSMLGIPLGRQHRPRVAWHGDADLLPHLRALLSVGAVDVQVVFGAEKRVGAGDDRKALAREAGQWVGKAVAEVNCGRDPTALLLCPAGPPH